jgi:hypothetical protein
MDAKIPVLILAAALSPALANDSDLESAPLRSAQASTGSAQGSAGGPQASRADDRTLARLREHMKRMRDTVAQLQETTHPDDRQDLIEAHERELRYGMKLMLEHEKAMEDGFR